MVVFGTLDTVPPAFLWGIEGAAPLTSPGLLEAAKRAKSNTGTLANNQYSKKKRRAATC